MLKWLRNYFLAEAVAENSRLKAEVEFWKEQFEKAKESESAANGRLFKEINANRRREDAKNAKILELSGVRERLPERSFEETSEFEETNKNDPPTPPESDVTEREILAVANQIVEQAKQVGKLYTEDNFKALCDEIRKNPEEYGL